jgi:Caspase domain
MRFVLALCAALAVMTYGLAAHAAGKVALVIGNGAYVNANKLPNPPNDASDMAAALEKLGFTVIGGNDLDFAGMGAKIGEFEDAARDADVTLLFYAGHGLQVNGRNYLVPVNAKLERESSLQFEAIDSESILGAMTGPGKTAIALLDACRDNPLSRSFSRSLGKSRSTAVQQGLAVPVVAGGGILIGFATSPGDVAADGEGRNSPFTKALLKNINTPGLEIQQLMTRVKGDVYASTKESQEPWHNSSLRIEVYLAGEKAATVEVEIPKFNPQSDINAEWNALKDSNSLAALDVFIITHANSPVFVALAQDRKSELAQKIRPAEKNPEQQKTENDAFFDSLIIKRKPKPPEKTAEESQQEKDAILESLKIPDDPPQPEKTAKQEIKKLALNDLKSRAPAAKSTSSLNDFFAAAKSANQGNAAMALLNLGVNSVDIPPPAQNPGSKARSLKLKQVAKAPAIEALLASNSSFSLTEAASASCWLHQVYPACALMSAEFYDGLKAAMAANDMDITNGTQGFYSINHIAGSSDYFLSNTPKAGTSRTAVIGAIVTENLEVKQMFGFDISQKKLGASAGDPTADMQVTWSAVDGDDLYVSFDAAYRCTAAPRKYGFITKFSMSDSTVKWVSPFNVSDNSFILKNDYIIAANGGSCVDDFLYILDKATGQIMSRAKLPTAVEHMDDSSGSLVVELYEGAVAYEVP